MDKASGRTLSECAHLTRNGAIHTKPQPSQHVVVCYLTVFDAATAAPEYSGTLIQRPHNLISAVTGTFTHQLIFQAPYLTRTRLLHDPLSRSRQVHVIFGHVFC